MTALRNIMLGGVAVAFTAITAGMFLRRGQAISPTVAPAASTRIEVATNEHGPSLADGATLAQRWQQWLVQLDTPGHEMALATEFESLVRANPRGALAFAEQQREPRRSSLVQTILLLWSAIDPSAAAAEVRTLPDSERAAAVAAVLSGAADRPDEAVKLAVEFCRDDPALASQHGYALIAALGRNGEFRRAIQFALENGNAGADEDHSKWLKQAFAQWAAQNPTMALAAGQDLPQPGDRFEALEAISANRLRTDPRGLAETLRRLPPGADRSLVLAQSLRAWARQDPKNAAEWIDRLEPSVELDAGSAAIAEATQGQLQNRRPEVALSWGESIVAPDLRSRTIAAVVLKWAATDREAALAYAETSNDLLDENRAALLRTLNKNATRDAAQ
ncbi:MAG TPA: hypothetical protein VFT72_15415 [Opitutaceae bacterium]|nr:hypothetical protein [Opitutaceae bacterium]